MKNKCKLFLLIFVLVFSENYAKTGPYLVVNNPHHSGFFATFYSILGALDYYEKNSYAGITVNLDSYMYLDPNKGPNWWEYYFEPIQIGEEAKEHYIFSYEDTHSLIKKGYSMPRQWAYEIIQKYIHLRPEIYTEVNQFILKNFQNNYVIGLHYRGTDKILESPRISYERVYEIVQLFLFKLSIAHPNIKIYVATDEQNFLDFMKLYFPNQIISSPFVRSSTNDPIHYSTTIYQNNYQKGKEALIDCLLLSRCNHLIRSDSSLSMVSTYFNPNIPTLTLTP